MVNRLIFSRDHSRLCRIPRRTVGDCRCNSFWHRLIRPNLKLSVKTAASVCRWTGLMLTRQYHLKPRTKLLRPRPRHQVTKNCLRRLFPGKTLSPALNITAGRIGAVQLEHSALSGTVTYMVDHTLALVSRSLALRARCCCSIQSAWYLNSRTSCIGVPGLANHQLLMYYRMY